MKYFLGTGALSKEKLFTLIAESADFSLQSADSDPRSLAQGGDATGLILFFVVVLAVFGLLAYMLYAFLKDGGVSTNEFIAGLQEAQLPFTAKIILFLLLLGALALSIRFARGRGLILVVAAWVTVGVLYYFFSKASFATAEGQSTAGPRTDGNLVNACGVCMEVETLLALTPCGHTLCRRCRDRCGARCPICRGSVTGAQPVFI